MKFRCDIKNINNLDFPDLLKFWYDITCYHRKISKQLPPKKYLNNYNKNEGRSLYIIDQPTIYSLNQNYKCISILEEMSMVIQDVQG